MENDIIYFSDFPNLQETGTRKDNGKFDLTLLPTQELKEEFRGYIMYTYEKPLALRYLYLYPDFS